MRATILLGLGAVAACGPEQGTLEVLTYNVAGLPEGLSSSQPERFIPVISPLLNRYELALVQEDFYYTELLRRSAMHPHVSEPKPAEEVESVMNDGLNRFSQIPFGPLHRERWVSCHGTFDSASDCLADKGFSVATHRLAEGVEVDVYNFHAEAGGGPNDVVARRAGLEQLIEHARARSFGRALILAGDTNLHGFDPDDEPLLVQLMNELDLEDACRNLNCGKELIDRVMFRSGVGVELSALGWRIADEMVDREGQALSDHLAVHVTLQWQGLD